MAVEAVCTVRDWVLLIRSSLALQVHFLQGMFSDLYISNHSFLNPLQFLSISQTGCQDGVQGSVNHIAAAPESCCHIPIHSQQPLPHTPQHSIHPLCINSPAGTHLQRTFHYKPWADLSIIDWKILLTRCLLCFLPRHITLHACCSSIQYYWCLHQFHHYCKLYNYSKSFINFLNIRQ